VYWREPRPQSLLLFVAWARARIGIRAFEDWETLSDKALLHHQTSIALANAKNIPQAHDWGKQSNVNKDFRLRTFSAFLIQRRWRGWRKPCR